MPDFLYFEQSLLSKKKKRQRRRRWFFIYLIGFFIFSGVILFSPILKIVSVNFEGATGIADERLDGFVSEFKNSQKAFIFSADNILFFNINEFKQEFQESFPRLEVLNLNVNWFKRLVKVNFRERTPLFIWCDKMGEECFYVDQAGIAYERSPITVGNLILKVFAGDGAVLGEMVRGDNFFERLAELVSKLGQYLAISPTSVFIEDSNVVLEVAGGWQLLLNIDFEVENSLNVTQGLFEQEILENRRQDLDYVDLRFPDRAYYKYKE
jgi:hypothetical protein